MNTKQTTPICLLALASLSEVNLRVFCSFC